MIAKLNIVGKVIGKQRPKFSSRGGFVKTYTPDQTINYENYVKMLWLQSGQEKLTGNIKATIDAEFLIPKSFSKKKQAALDGAYCSKKPDCDNIAKSILDALNGIAYDDDSQIVELTVRKYYTGLGEVAILILEEVE